MEDLSFIAQTSPNLWVSIFLTAVGMFLYWGIIVQAVYEKKRSTFSFSLWWGMNVLNVLLSVIVCISTFIISWTAETLTFERCLFMGVLVSLLIDKLKRGVLK